MEIPEIIDLNLTHIEYSNNVDVNDPSRGKYKFTSVYDVETEESWMNDFIDLDALKRNIINAICESRDASGDCFGCVHNKTGSLYCSKDECSLDCIYKEELSNKFESKHTPIVIDPSIPYCYSPCNNSYVICCKDCRVYDKCTLDDKCIKEEFESCDKYITCFEE